MMLTPQVAQICEICIRNNWIRPTIYQGVYNVFSRRIEDELIPCLRHYKISFYAYAPLAGGLMTGKYSRDQTNFEPGSRFAPGTVTSRIYHSRFWNDLYFDGIEEVKAAADKHGLTLAEVALRWLSWHSKLERETGDAVIVGASSVKHLEQNLQDLEKGQLPEEVTEAANSAYSKVRAVAPPYYQ
jgi:aflatoxin B1 aldehyde reductase